MKRFYTLIFLLIVFPSVLFTQTVRYVDQSGGYPGSFLTITDAVSAATAGDTLKVFSGTYNEPVTISKKLYMYAQDSTAEVVSGTDAFTFGSGSAGSLINGFTLRGNVNTGNFVKAQPIIIANNKFIYSTVTVYYWTIIANNSFTKTASGYGISIAGSDSSHKRIVIFNNRLDSCGIICSGNYNDVINNSIINYSGSGITMSNFIECKIIANKINNCLNGIRWAGYSNNINFLFSNNLITNCQNGIYFDYGSSLSGTIMNNVIYNSTTQPVGSSGGLGGTVNFYNNIFANNTGNLSCEIAVWSYNCFYSSGTVPSGIGNISSNPLFTNTGSGDFTLQAGSPAINAGHPNVLYSDIDRTRNDMGIYGGSNSMANYEYTTGPKIFSLAPIPAGVIKGNTVTITGSGVAK
jgi:hypothetical protein